MKQPKSLVLSAVGLPANHQDAHLLNIELPVVYMSPKLAAKEPFVAFSLQVPTKSGISLVSLRTNVKNASGDNPSVGSMGVAQIGSRKLAGLTVVAIYESSEPKPTNEPLPKREKKAKELSAEPITESLTELID